jgi:hypothetical protein
LEGGLCGRLAYKIQLHNLGKLSRTKALTKNELFWELLPAEVCYFLE